MLLYPAEFKSMLFKARNFLHTQFAPERITIYFKRASSLVGLMKHTEIGNDASIRLKKAKENIRDKIDSFHLVIFNTWAISAG